MNEDALLGAGEKLVAACPQVENATQELKPYAKLSDHLSQLLLLVLLVALANLLTANSVVATAIISPSASGKTNILFSKQP